MTNRDAELVGVEYAGEVAPFIKPSVSDRQKVIILREDGPTKPRCTFEDLLVISRIGVVFCTGNHVNTAPPEPVRDGSFDVVVHVQSDGHGRCPRFFSFSRTEESCRLLLIS